MENLARLIGDMCRIPLFALLLLLAKLAPTTDAFGVQNVNGDSKQPLMDQVRQRQQLQLQKQRLELLKQQQEMQQRQAKEDEQKRQQVQQIQGQQVKQQQQLQQEKEQLLQQQERLKQQQAEQQEQKKKELAEKEEQRQQQMQQQKLEEQKQSGWMTRSVGSVQRRSYAPTKTTIKAFSSASSGSYLESLQGAGAQKMELGGDKYKVTVTETTVPAAQQGPAHPISQTHETKEPIPQQAHTAPVPAAFKAKVDDAKVTMSHTQPRKRAHFPIQQPAHSQQTSETAKAAHSSVPQEAVQEAPTKVEDIKVPSSGTGARRAHFPIQQPAQQTPIPPEASEVEESTVSIQEEVVPTSIPMQTIKVEKLPQETVQRAPTMVEDAKVPISETVAHSQHAHFPIQQPAQQTPIPTQTSKVEESSRPMPQELGKEAPSNEVSVKDPQVLTDILPYLPKVEEKQQEKDEYYMKMALEVAMSSYVCFRCTETPLTC